MNPIEFFLDGKAVTAQPGQTILEVARANGFFIPTLCREQRISRTTSCFVCVVRDQKTGRFLPSCSSCPAPGQQVEVTSEAVLEMRKTAFELLLSEHSGDCDAPCEMACPAHAAVEEYVRAGKEGDFRTALEIIKERIPLPMSIGRVCPRFCEKDCRKNLFGGAVAINEFKRTAADRCYEEYMEELPPDTGHRVAIVGGGPGGLSAAYYLRREGVQATIFEAMPAAGGMIRYGIPEYRMPKELLNKELAHFEKMGIQFRFGQKLGENLTLEELQKSFDAVIVAVGCWKASGMRCEGEELAVQGIDFLRGVALAGNTGANPGKVVVIGGGNTAMDCVRTAVRLGSSDVNCFYRRTEAEMPAEKIEIHEAKEEGVQFHFLAAPVSLRRGGDGRLVLTCRRMELGEPDAGGRRKPVEVPGSDYEVIADTVIAAIGQSTAAPAGLPTDRRGNLTVTAGSMRIGEKLYGAGDCVSGAATVVEAVASGRLAALNAVTDLTGKEFPAEPVIFVSRGHWQSMQKEDVVVQNESISNEPRKELKFISLEERKTTFREVTETMTPEMLAEEGKRCIECSCSAKGDCKLREYAGKAGAKVDAITGSKLAVAFDNRHPVILQDRGKCVKCSVCVKVCAEVVNQSLLSPMKRGFFTSIGTAFDRGFPASCAECGECVRACPTGALGFKKQYKDGE